MNFRSKFTIASTFGAVVVAGALLADIMRSAPSKADDKVELQLDVAATAAAEYLRRSVNGDGSFIYSYDPVRDRSKDTYNILRHAGALFSMIEYYDSNKSKAMLEAINRSIGYLLQTMKPCPQTPKDLCVIEDDATKLGGNGLALLALSEYTAVTGDSSHLEVMRRLASRLNTVQKPSGEFGFHKQHARTGEDMKMISEYYPGESIFALVRFYDVDSNRKWLDTAKRATDWLINVRDKDLTIESIEHDHWLLYGLDKLYTHFPEKKILEHARKIVDAILAAQISSHQIPAWIGGYRTPPSSTPAATRSEGLMAAHRLFSRVKNKPAYAAYPDRILKAVQLSMQFQLSTQVTSERQRLLGFHGHALGGFTSSLTEFDIRNDYVQHNLSSILALQAALEK
ncbi:MAG: beta-L-arabinofuranosidase domain-containing protein [Oligoflexales bacterium]